MNMWTWRGLSAVTCGQTERSLNNTTASPFLLLFLRSAIIPGALMATKSSKSESLPLVIHVLVCFLLCMRAIPSGLCLDDEDGLKVKRSCMGSERRALLAIKADMYDSDWWLTSWSGQDCCRWRGVGCDETTGYVIKLDLRNPAEFEVPAPSKINPSLLELTHLNYLDLSKNNFQGSPIPGFIGSLMHLEYLNLSMARFEGPIPHQLGNLSSLRFLDLHSSSYSANSLRVDDLHWLSHITSLQYLDMSGIDLSMASDWLHDVGMLPSLAALHLSFADLPVVPTTLTHVNFTSLAVLDLSWSYFTTRSIPWWLSNISSLVELHLGGCNFHGEMLDAVGELNDLHVLDLSFNHINGGIPQKLGNLSRLEYLDLAKNQLTGDISHMSWNLRHLDLFSNQFTGDVRRMLWNLSHLEYLDLSKNGIGGEIPASIGDLANLTTLDLSWNQISGWMPESIGDLVNLQGLYLSRNNISGQIPETIGNLTNLLELDVSMNSIAGRMPETMGKLYNLQELHLSDNSIGGEIPRSMGSLCKLNQIDLSNNSIGGEITGLVEGLSTCIQNSLDRRRPTDGLKAFRMGENNLNGTVPKSIGQLSGLLELDLSLNSFSGPFAEAHFANLRNLTILDLSYNSLDMILGESWVPPFNATYVIMCSCHVGPRFPSWIQTQKNLHKLCLSEAGISDYIPAWFWDSWVDHFNASHNHLMDSFSGPLPNLASFDLDFINLSNNSFSGPIPSSFALAMNIGLLLLSHNHINGSIPSFFCNLTSLEFLDLSNNNLSGGLPDCRQKSQLLVVNSTENMSGNLPSSVASPLQLQSLHLRNNNLSGKFPSFLKHCKQLVILDLGENKFSGNIPTWIQKSLSKLKVLRLRSNSFTGTIPMEITSLTSLQVLDLAHNNLQGNLPSSFGRFNAMVATLDLSKPVLSNYSMSFYYTESLLITTKGIDIEYTRILSIVTSIDLSDNNLSGEILKELTSLQGLYSLNLSKNHFTGRIPEDMNALGQLESLDLSMNSLSGVIPSSMSSLNYLSHLNLSYNNFSGRIPSGNQFLTFDDPSTYLGNPNLCGWPLQGCLDAPAQAPLHKEDQEEEKNSDGIEMIWIYASSALGFVVGFWAIIGTILIKQEIRIAYFRFIDKICDWIYVASATRFAKLKSLALKNNQER